MRHLTTVLSRAKWLFTTLPGVLFLAAVLGGVGVASSPVFNGNLVGAVAQGFPNPYVASPAPPTAGSKAEIDQLSDRSSPDYVPYNIGGLWSNNSYFNMLASKEFTATNTTNGSNSPASAFAAYAINNGSTNDVAGMMPIGYATASNAAVWGENQIALSASGITSPKLVGDEIDIEPAAGVTPSSSSAGLYINGFNSVIPVAMQIGTLGGGSFTNGILIGGIASTGAAIGPQGSASMASFLNTSPGTYSTAAIVLGNGISQGIALKGTSTGYGDIFTDGSSNLTLRAGPGNVVGFQNNSGTLTGYVNNTGIVSQGTIVGLAHNVCSASSGVPCEGSVTCSISAATSCSTTGTVPSSAVCSITSNASDTTTGAEWWKVSLSTNTLTTTANVASSQSSNASANVTCL